MLFYWITTRNKFHNEFNASLSNCTIKYRRWKKNACKGRTLIDVIKILLYSYASVHMCMYIIMHLRGWVKKANKFLNTRRRKIISVDRLSTD